MKTNVSTLLREFPKIRRAALSGQDVIVVTREGNLKITADNDVNSLSILGALKGSVNRTGDDLDQPTTESYEWESQQ